MPLDVLDAASNTETGSDEKVVITNLQINKSCQSATGAINIAAVYGGIGDITYTLDNSTTNKTGQFLNIAPGPHMIRASAAEGVCINDSSFVIQPAYNLVNSIVKTNPDNCANIPGSIMIDASSINGGVTYTLLNSGLSKTSGDFTNLRGGRYDFRIMDGGGCSKDTSVALSENMPIGGCNDIFIPNAFTPNNDGRNDLYTISLPTSFKNVAVQIFGRWGNIVYQSKGNNMSWDGSYKGEQQPVGVYIYNLTYTNPDGLPKNLKGTLTLIR